MRFLFKISVLLLCIVSVVSVGISQSIKFKKFSLKNGLPHSTVFRMLQQDTTGMIWLGTNYGLSRYDGYEFINFSFDEPVSLNTVLAIAELNTDSLLISFYREGLYIFSNGKLLPIQQKGVGSYDNIKSLVKGDGSYYAIATSSNLLEYKNSKLKQLNLSYKEEGVLSTCIDFSSNYGLLIGTPKGLYRYKDGVHEKLNFPILANRRIDFIQVKNDGSIIVSSNDKVFKIYNNKVSLLWDVGALCQHSITYEDDKGNIWRASPEQGLLLKRENTITNVNSLLDLEEEIINCIKQDGEGNLWVGTRSNGVFCINISDYTKTLSQTSNEKLNYTAVLSTDDYDWVASRGRLYRATELGLEEVKNEFINQIVTIYNLFQDKEGRVLISTPLGVLAIDKDDNHEAIANINGSIDFCYNNKGELLVSSFKGLFVLKGNKLTPYLPEAIPVKRVNCLLTDKEGYTWLGGEEKLYKVKDGVLTVVKENIKVFDLLLDHTNTIWVATSRGVFNYKQSTEKHYTPKEGLSHNLCKALEEDDKGRVWAGTLKGLCYFERSDNAFYPYDIQPFEEVDEIVTLSFLDGELLVGTINDAYKVKRKVPNYRPSIVISKIIIGDSIFYGPQSFTLPYKSNGFSVYFSSVAVAYGKQLRYETKLTPLDTGWQATANNNINYKNLPPGNYEFHVRVKNHANGQFSRVETLRFSVFTPFWQRKWFIVSIVLVLLVAVICIHRIRLNILRKQHQKKSAIEKQLLYLKMQAMNALMNPHFISNVLHSIISYLEHLKPGQRVDDRYIAYFSELIRLNLINSDKSYIALRDELRRIELYILLEQFRFKDHFAFSIKINPDIDEANIEIPNMIVQPFVENAINHGLLPARSNGKLLVSIKSLSNDLIEISISDNGVGIKESKAKKIGTMHRSMGIKLVKERMEAAEQTHPIFIEDLSENNASKTGTKVTIVLEV